MSCIHTLPAGTESSLRHVHAAMTPTYKLMTWQSSKLLADLLGHFICAQDLAGLWLSRHNAACRWKSFMLGTESLLRMRHASRAKGVGQVLRKAEGVIDSRL